MSSFWYINIFFLEKEQKSYILEVSVLFWRLLLLLLLSLFLLLYRQAVATLSGLVDGENKTRDCAATRGKKRTDHHGIDY